MRKWGGQGRHRGRWTPHSAVGGCHRVTLEKRLGGAWGHDRLCAADLAGNLVEIATYNRHARRPHAHRQLDHPCDECLQLRWHVGTGGMNRGKDKRRLRRVTPCEELME